jgi:hypothetical protein
MGGGAAGSKTVPPELGSVNDARILTLWRRVGSRARCNTSDTTGGVDMGRRGRKRRELGAVVTANELRLRAPDATNHLVQAGAGGIGVDGVLDEIGQGLADELVDDVQDLDHPPGGS